MLAASPLPPIVQALVPLAVGLYTSLLGYGVVPASLDAKKAQTWKKRYGSTAQIGGPLLIIAGLVLGARSLWV
ncbi:MAG: hypothetical protein JSS20_04070 [Proteobacteria bacterium]|nr:hypothetical protein [Pseudomonadota bacterium]